MSFSYQPTCSIEMLHQRAKMYRKIRTFFDDRGVIEVETPILSAAATTDVYLASVAAHRHLNGKLNTHYLQTSPEFAMKRLLASGSGPIYQICKVFRDDEHGRKHNSEFTMLEWYRPHFSLNELMYETAALIELCCFERLGTVQPKVLSYKHAFQQCLGINPLQAGADELKIIAEKVGLSIDLGNDRLGYMDLLFSHHVEPTLGFDHPIFLTDFPQEMASLAKVRIDDDGEAVAARFEVYVEGLELANAYDELADTQILAERFEADNLTRQSLGLKSMPIDQNLLTAIEHLPACSGIALGLDRLLMVAERKLSLHEVLTYPAHLA